MLPLPCMLVCIFSSANRTRDRGCSKHPVFPAPSIQEEGDGLFKPRAKHAARSRRCIRVIASAAKQSLSPLAGPMLHPGYARIDCGADMILLIVVSYQDAFTVWRQALNPPGVAAGTHSGLKRAVARESAELFT